VDGAIGVVMNRERTTKTIGGCEMGSDDFDPITFTFAAEIFDDWLADEYPEFQRRTRDEPARAVLLDFQSCEFVSPLPVLAIATELMTNSTSKRSIDINLGAGGIGSTADNKARSRKFLSLHGFLSAFLSREDLPVRFQFDQTSEAGGAGVWHCGKDGLQALRPLLERSSTELAYGELVVVSATTWRLPNPDGTGLSADIRKQVGTLLRQADASLFRFKTEARKYRDTTLQRITQVLLELVENAAEHAYQGDQAGFVGIYARVRSARGVAARSLRAKELGRSILLEKILVSEEQHQVEVFVVDVGGGLFADAARWKGVTQSALRRTPLRRTSQLLFSRPLSRHDRNDALVKELRGSSTGLMHLDAILSHQHDRTRIVTGNEWLAGPHPRGPAFSEGGSHTGGYHLERNRLAGTIFHIGISPAEIPRLDSPWFASDDVAHKEVRAAVLSALSAAGPPLSLQSRVVDIRRNDALGDIGLRVMRAAQSDSSTVIRLSRVADKNLINAMLDAWLKGIAIAAPEASGLYLCDLGRYQAIDAVWVINSFFRRRPITWTRPKKAAIFVVTEDLCLLRLDLEETPAATGARSGWLSASPTPESPTRVASRLFAVLQELRVCDSDLLWKRVAVMMKGTGAAVLLQDVLWDRPAGAEVLPNYLDFSLLAQDQEAARYIRRALRRLLALFPDATDFPLDPLVEASLHDAKKWLIRPSHEQSARVLVGSLSVSGSTLARYSDVPGTVVVGAIDCVRTPYFQPDSGQFPHVAALLWDPTFQVRSTNRAKYRRLAKSAFIEPIRQAPRLDPIEYDERLYEALETEALLKIGHWSYGDRHSLIEINAELAIEQSSASESGAIPWLSKQIADAGRDADVIIAFPVHRLAYRLAHNIEARLRMPAEMAINATLLPLSFLPRVAGGISRLTPLTLERARSLATYPTAKKRVAFFLDVGFITNRTLRHVVRQFKAVGFGDVRALGLLNRSSAPAFDTEQDGKDALNSSVVPIPRAFWRWNVPTMGTGAHCALCGALPALGRIRRVIDKSHPDLIPHLELIADRWRARDVADFWDEYGLRPLPLLDVQLLRLGAIRTALDLDDPAIALTSTTFAARILEHFRFTGDIGLPLRAAGALLEGAGDHAIELLLSVLLLTGGTIAPADLHDCVSMLIRATLMEASTTVDSDVNERRSRLLGLVALVLAVQSSRCKLEVVNQLVSNLRLVEVRDPALRIALIALTTDSDESMRVQRAFAEACADAPTKSILRHNFQALRPAQASARETWENLTQAFGRSESHSQHSVLGKLLSKVRMPGMAKSKLVPQVEQLSNLLGQCDPRYVLDAFGFDLQGLVDSVRNLERRTVELGVVDGVFEKSIDESFEGACQTLHASLVRYGDRAKYPLIYMLFKDMLRDCAAIHKLSLGGDIVFTRDARVAKWPSDNGDYLPLCGHISRLFDEIMSNVASKSVITDPPEGARYAGMEDQSRCWLWFDIESEPLLRGMSLVFVNGISQETPARKFEARVGGLRDFGVEVTSREFQSRGHSYYEVRVRLPSLTSILEHA
jgi:hypothetical protein